ncbi:hypothetical protein TR2A62_3389 [Thalassobium sp. R2A62]|jgi:hypothetical protein|nr:hypothetical protein TR2A62_3389 [Thalassobium sp. R2A62]
MFAGQFQLFSNQLVHENRQKAAVAGTAAKVCFVRNLVI